MFCRCLGIFSGGEEVSSQLRREHDQNGTEKSVKEANEIHDLRSKNAILQRHIEKLNQAMAEKDERLEDQWTILRGVEKGRNAGDETVIMQLGAEKVQLEKRLKEKSSKLLKVEKDAKRRNERKDIRIKRLEDKVAELRRQNEDANQQNSKWAWEIKKLVARVAELDRPLQDKTVEPFLVEAENQRSTRKGKKVEDLNASVAELSRLLDEKNIELSRIEAESQRNARKARNVDGLEARTVELEHQLREATTKLSDMEEAENGRKARGRSIDHWHAEASELNERLRGEKAKVSRMEENAWRKQKDTERLEAQVAELEQRLHGETAKISRIEEAARRPGSKEKDPERLGAKVVELEQHLQEKTVRLSSMEEAARRHASREKDLERLRAKVAELEQRLRWETGKVSRMEEDALQKQKDTERLQAQVVELNQRLRGETRKISSMEEAARRHASKEKDSERLGAKIADLERRLQEKTGKLASMEDVARQNSRKEREGKRLETKVAELELRLQEKTTRLSNLEGTLRQNSRKGEGSERLEATITELNRRLQESGAKLSNMKDDVSLQEQRIRELSSTNQRQRDEMNQMKTASRNSKRADEQANWPPPPTQVSGADKISAMEVADLVRILNAQIDQVASFIADSLYYRGSPRSEEELVALIELRDYIGPWLFNDLRSRSNEADALITQITLQTGLVHACSRIINHWNPPFWNDGLMFFRVFGNTAGVGQTIAGTWSALARSYIAKSQGKAQDANVKYLSEILLKLITAIGGSTQSGQTLPPDYREKVEDIARKALELHQIVSEDVSSMDLVTFTIPTNTQFDPSQMEDTEGAESASHDKVVCTLEMGLQYRKRVELGKQGKSGEECSVTLKPKVVLSATLRA